MLLIEHLVSNSSDRLINYHHFVKHADKSDKLSLKLKLHFLRSISKLNAIQKSPSPDNSSSIKCVIERDKTWNSTLDFLSKYTPTELTIK